MLYNALLILALLVAGFVFWKRGREEHFAEDVLLDAFLFSALGGLVAARIFFIIFHFSEFGWSVASWMNIFAHAGLNLPFGAVFALVFLVRSSKAQQWDILGILDMWLPGLAAGAAVQQLGVLLTGTSVQVQVGSFGVPLSIIAVIALALISRYLYWLEYRYRTFAWYKSSQDVAKTGFITGLGIASMSMLFLLIEVFRTPGDLWIQHVSLIALFGLGIVVGLGVVLQRSPLLSFGSKKKR